MRFYVTSTQVLKKVKESSTGVCHKDFVQTNGEIMDCSTPLNISNALIYRSNERKENWENSFEKNREAFSRKVSEGIMGNVILKLEETFKDCYRQVPSKTVPLTTNFSFEIVTSKGASALKELVKEGAELPPFKEWIERFSLPNQKIGADIDLTSNFSSSSLIQFPEKEKGIDREYFQEMMALVGQSVEIQLKKLIQELTSLPQNSSLKAEVVWHRNADQLISNISNSKDNSIDVKIWVEDRAIKELEAITSIGSHALMNQREIRRKNQFCKQTLRIAGVVFIALLAFLVLTKKN